MASYLFIFGRTPELSYHELKAFFPKALRLSTNCASVSEFSSDSPKSLIRILGGTVKIGEVLGTIASLTPRNLATFFPEGAASQVFGVSCYGTGPMPESILRTIKTMLAERNSSHIRYVMGREGRELSSVLVAKQGIYELLLVPQNEGYAVAKTIAVQPFSEWSKRDYGRPYADPKAGMLPPKVARMIVNIALGPESHSIVLDPFCGMGTICTEAILRGAEVYGSDHSSDVLAKAQANAKWLGNYDSSISEAKYHFFASDATHVSAHLQGSQIDAIVTEGFLGRSDIAVHTEKIPDVARGLEKLVIGCLRDWRAVLKPRGRILMSVPTFVVKSHEVSVKKPIDMCETLGYTKVLGPIEYARLQALVKREFYLLQKKE